MKNGLNIIKPNLLIFGNKIFGLDLDNKCVSHNGTSVSSTLLASIIFMIFNNNEKILNFGNLFWLIKKYT